MTISETIFNSKFDAMLKEMKAIKELLVIIVEGFEPDVICDAQEFPITIIAPPKPIGLKDDEDNEDNEDTKTNKEIKN